jgi:multiple sugar transport system ATP-binding protein
MLFVEPYSGSAMASVELQHVDKVYEGGIKAVADFNLHIQNEEFVVLVGPSGCGKTTTLRMIAGLEDVTGGTIRIGGQVVNNTPPKDRDIAMVFQSYALYPHMTVYENMAFGLKMRNVEPNVIRAKIRNAADILDISDLLERRPKQLSGGQRQRVALGRAIVRDPKCFLFDEPLSNLDAKLRVEMRAELKRLHLSLKSTTVYVTHDQEEAVTLGDRLVVMKSGLMQQCDGALKIYHWPANRFVASFLGNPPMNFFEGQLIDVASVLYVDEGSMRLRLTDAQAMSLRHGNRQTVVVGIRPEAISTVSFLPSSDCENTGEASVSLVQPLGDKMNVHLTTDAGHKLVAHVDAFEGLCVAQRLKLRFDMRRAHFFATGEDGINLMTGN